MRRLASLMIDILYDIFFNEISKAADVSQKDFLYEAA